jgi:drug/metabolite transporter (DMT)-like permease
MLDKLKFSGQPLELDSELLGIVAVVLALVTLSSAAILIELSEAEIGPNATIFNRLWIATLVFWWWQSIQKTETFQSEKAQGKIKRSPQTNREWWLLILVAAASTGSVSCWAWSLTQTTVTNSTVLRNLTPLFTSLGSWVLLKQKFERKFLLGMFLAIIGAVTIGWDDFQIAGDRFWGDLLALLSAFLYAVYLLVSEKLRIEFNTVTILLWRCAIGTLLILPIVLLTEESLFPNSWQGWLIVISLAVICQGIGQGLLIYSLNQFSSSFLAVFLLLQPVLTALLAWLIFEETLNLINGLAFVLVLAGIYATKFGQSENKLKSD